MILSMTGFSSALIAIPIHKSDNKNGETLQCTLTLKSLNSRFFETTCKLPHMLAHLETELLKIFKARLYRGNINFTLYVGNPQVLKTQLHPSHAIINGYLRAIAAIQEEFKLPGTVSISELITLPNIFETAEEHLDRHVDKVIIDQINLLVDQLIDVRLQEGKALEQDLSDRLELMQQTLSLIKPRAELITEQRKQHLLQILPELSLEAQEQHRQLIYTQLEKMDIHEELVRFQAHCNALARCLAATTSENGKKIDFILQELFREINTIAAKCNDAEISSYTIAIKVELEKAREQAQNIV
jgi:uncharacterized protein (TIGR00255 family)